MESTCGQVFSGRILPVPCPPAPITATGIVRHHFDHPINGEWHDGPWQHAGLQSPCFHETSKTFLLREYATA